MNLNKKIQKFSGDGIPEYNKRINEVIDAANWLLGVRTINGKAIAESDQGPIFDLSQVSASQTGPNLMAIDPDGNQAGWRRITLFDPVRGSLFDVWAWTGANISNIRDAPWLYDSVGGRADWLVGQEGEVWGTGNYPGTPTSTNFQNVKFVVNDNVPNYKSPQTWTGNVPIVPITAPTVKPAFYLKSYYPSKYASFSHTDGPCISVGTYVPSQIPSVNITWTWTITYDGVAVLSYSGSVYVPNSPGWIDILLDKTGWTYDPTGIPGYSHGGGNWLYLYQGPISSNLNPTIIETFTYSTDYGPTGWIINWDAVILTG